MPGSYVKNNWRITDSITPVVCFTTAVFWALYILSFPPSTRFYRKLSILALALPTWYAFRHSDYLTPNYYLDDTFGRTCLIWFVHMSYEVCVMEFAPVLTREKRSLGDWDQKKERVRQGYKVLFDRNHTQVLEQQGHILPKSSHDAISAAKEEPSEERYVATDKKTDEPVLPSARVQHGVVLPMGHRHGYSRWEFLGYHILKLPLYYAAQCAFTYYEENYSPGALDPATYMGPGLLSFFDRITMSIGRREISWRLMYTFDWCISSMWLYEGYHSIFAVLWVGSGLDGPEEWSKCLFGSLSTAWSVRRYWAKHWHNFVYHSLTGHIKCVTRGWLGMQRGAISTRLIENTLVFFVSGLIHALVRWQQVPMSDHWGIACWYVAQMLPIITEMVVAHQWRKLRKWLGYGTDSKWLNRFEYAVGYSWVIAWFLYSVPKYYQTRMHWTNAIIRKKIMADMAADGNINKTGSG
ncbi:uncharacterized protein J4E87_002676 [Alternaria ethzedia]|uniref:uncharacterized protein n=1 Tax=Alternaria triticimaculans TaxID=297637 RepID=UPI0020C4279F|nr:uncharacterized protein J4E78_004411 [Alternaria triticimaculans]XP_049236452.1 uncharacterized protein J4E87_002676 [Alternaria ethzedia]XP_049243711.1 uncharacterized protein J4E84_006221 [Alternaria hordeiaustralica]XP_051349460.1 uncharacterized protein J4E92_009023 [Alternaria infectoria]KAI4616622.1 hypothetical protein J4E80_005896 [Alternaria sp. BMP 0032]KAI4706220.1 hypothetical protein J4E89_008953 [Alternaria sp. Ai002NY15]KAI4631969.1 hypothetical protein J4E87_002676 [Alterna